MGNENPFESEIVIEDAGNMVKMGEINEDSTPSAPFFPLTICFSPVSADSEDSASDVSTGSKSGSQVSSDPIPSIPVSIPCPTCTENVLIIASYKDHCSRLVRDLSDCEFANKCLKENESVLKKTNKDLEKQNRETSNTVLNKQDTITEYLNIIAKTKKELAILHIDYDTLNSKLNSYASSSYIIEHMVRERKENKSSGIGYNNCPPPVMGILNKSLDENPITEFVVSTPLIVDPLEANKASEELKQKVNDEGEAEKAQGKVEECEIDDGEEIPRGLGFENANSSSAASSSNSKTVFESKPTSNHQECHSPPPTLNKFLRATDTKATDQKVLGQTNVDFFAQKHQAKKVQEPKTKSNQNLNKPCPPKAQRPSVVPQSSKFNKTGKREVFDICGSSNPKHWVHGFVQKEQKTKRAPQTSTKGSWFDRPRKDQQQNFPKLVERRYCFECGTKGHIVANCPYLQKQKGKVDPFNGKQPQILKSKSTFSPAQRKPLVNDQSKAKVKELLKSDSCQPQTTSASQSTVYFKQALHKQSTWKAKSETASESNIGGASSQPSGQWVDCTMLDEYGKPKTVKAWVPNFN